MSLDMNSRFRIRDDCSEPLFRSQGVSIQHDAKGIWWLVMQFNPESGYLQRELNKVVRPASIYLDQKHLQVYQDEKGAVKADLVSTNAW